MRNRRAALRAVGNQVETAIWPLRHPRTGRTVTLIGTMHIGDSRYFTELSSIVERLAAPGVEIHLEGVAHRGEDRLTVLERRRLAEVAGWTDPETSGAAVALLRLESQSGFLRLPEGTRNIDMSHGELLRRVGWTEYRRLFAPGPEEPPPGLAPFVRTAIRFQLRHSRGLDRLRSLAPRYRRVNRVVIGERNAVAFAGACDALRQGDVVLLWGCDHLPGLARLFTRAGYRPQPGRWVSACTI